LITAFWSASRTRAFCTLLARVLGIISPSLDRENGVLPMDPPMLGQLVGIHEALLREIVNGYRTPDAEMRARIAAVLQNEEFWLFAPAEAAAGGDGTLSAQPKS